MFKKKTEKKINFYDEQMREMLNGLTEIGSEMSNRVERAYIKAQAVSVYLEHSPDWEQAIKDRNHAQELVHCSIGMYDNLRGEILRFTEKYRDKMEESWNKTLTSHEWIERTVARLSKKN